MRKYLRTSSVVSLLFFSFSLFTTNIIYAQCNNADFESGNFSGWWGTYGQCGAAVIANACFCQTANAFQNNSMLVGPLNAASNSANQYSQTLCNTGNDALLGANGVTLPCVYPGGGNYSVRLGSNTALAEGESLTYTFLVTANNCNFTYHYAVVLDDAGEATAAKPGFYITVKDSTTNTAITCASYTVSAQSTPGFDSVSVQVNGSATWARYKPWSSVFVPLNNYIGHYVSIQFVTHSCYPPGSGGCGGRHFAYAYLDCECAPLNLVASSPAICGGHTVTLTAPAGAASYAWSGPGIVGASNQQTVTVSDSGRYTVNMTTFGTPPCPFSLDTFITLSPSNPVANFTAPAACAGAATAFTDHSTPAGSITAWSWNFGDGSAAVTTQSPSHTYAAAGTYPVTLTITWPPCTADTTIDVTVNAVPTSTFTASTPVCENTPSTITYTGTGAAGDTYNWNFAGGTVVSGTGQGPYQVSWGAGGTESITLQVTSATGGCASTTTTQQVVVNPFPGVTVSANTAVCAGSNTTLTASGATTYTWSPATGLNTTTGNSVIATPATTTTYTVTGVSTNCTGSAQVTVTVHQIPTSAFSISGAVCQGQAETITYTGTASAAGNYNWNFAGGTVISGSGQGPYQVKWATAGTQNVTLAVTDSGCTSTTTTHAVTVNPTPSSVFTVTSPVCVGQNGTVTYSGTPSGTASYNWAFNGGTVISGSGVGPYQVTWPTSGTKVVTLAITDAGCASPIDTQLVVVNAVPTSTFNINPSSVCAYQNVTITFTGSASANANYVWGFNGGTLVSGTGAGPYQVNWSGAGSKTVTLSVTDNGCTSTLTSNAVTVNPTPSASFTDVTPICNNQPTTLTYTGTGTNAATYTWTYSGGVIISGANQGPIVVGWLTPGNKHVTLAVTENGCTSPIADSVIVVNAVPVASFTIAPASACVGQTSTVTFNGSADNAAVYTWNFGGGTTVSGSGAGPYTIAWPAAGTETITLSVTDNGCASNDTSATVIVNPVPVSNAGGPAVTFCSGDSVQIGTASTAGYTYTWQPANGLSNAAIANPYADGTVTGTTASVTKYYVSTSNAGCTNTDSIIVTINPLPVAAFTPPANQCFTGNSFNFTAGGTFMSSATFVWSFGANGVPATSTTQNQSVTFSAPGTQVISLTISQAGCDSSVFADSIQVYPMPVVSFASLSDSVCQGQQVCFNGTTTPGTYLWQFGDGQTSTLQNPCNVYNAPGVYTVSLNVQSTDGCNSDTVMPNLITVSANPVAAFIPTDATIQLPDDTITLFNHSQNASSYLWTFGSVGSSTDVNPFLTLPQYGTYQVVLRAYNAAGCVDSVEHKVIVLPPTAFFIPNAFSPNGDGRNDLFYIEMQEGVTVFKFEIFDRWGEKVHDGNFAWDGTYLGKPCPEGVYVYQVELGLAGQSNGIKRKGTVTLLK